MKILTQRQEIGIYILYPVARRRQLSSRSCYCRFARRLFNVVILTDALSVLEDCYQTFREREANLQWIHVMLHSNVSSIIVYVSMKVQTWYGKKSRFTFEYMRSPLDINPIVTITKDHVIIDIVQNLIRNKTSFLFILLHMLSFMIKILCFVVFVVIYCMWAYTYHHVYGQMISCCTVTISCVT